MPRKNDDDDRSLAEQLLDEVDAFEKSLDDFDAPPADRIVKAKAMDENAGEAPGKDEEYEEGMEEDEEEEEEKGKGKGKGRYGKKSIADQLLAAEADLDDDDDFDPEILKSLGELDGDEDGQINAKELMKGLSRQITAQVGLIGEGIATLEEKVSTMQKAQLRLTKGLTRVQGNVNAIADEPAGRRSARSAGMSTADFAKAQQINGRTWEHALDACQVAVEKGDLDSRSAAKLETCFNKSMPIIEAQAMFQDIFKAIGPHMKEVTLQ